MEKMHWSVGGGEGKCGERCGEVCGGIGRSAGK